MDGDQALPAAPDVGNEIAVAYGKLDITRGFLRPDGTIYNEDVVLALTLGGDLRMYEDLLRDDQVMSTFEQRRTAVVSSSWSVEAGADDAQSKAAAEFLELQLRRVSWDSVTDKMLFTRFFGFGVAELLWDVTADDGGAQRFGWSQIRVRDRKRFLHQADGRMYLNTGSFSAENRIYCEAPYFWRTVAGASHDDNYYGVGLAQALYWLVRFKRDGLRFWMTFLEKFGMPTAIGTFEPGATQDAKQKLLNAILAIQTQAGVIIPKGMEISLLEAMRSGTGNYDVLEKYLDAAIAKVCVGQTLTTEVGASGSRALGHVHAGVRQDLIKSDSDIICESFNKGPVRWLTDFNFHGAKYPRVKRETEAQTDLTALATELFQLDAIGFRPTLEMVRENWGADMEEAPPPEPPTMIPPAVGFPPAPGTKPKPALPIPGQKRGAQFAAMALQFTAATRALFPDQTALDGGLDAFETRIAELSRDHLRGLLDYANTHTPQQMLVALKTSLPGFNSEELVESLARVIFVAKTVGHLSGTGN
jgi:phage gp29-like protein